MARRRGDWDVVETPELARAKAEIERLMLSWKKELLSELRNLERQLPGSIKRHEK